MKNQNIITIIGRTAFGANLCDGQTIRTKILYSELKKEYPNYNIEVVDTYNYKKKPLRKALELISAVKNSNVIIMLLSQNGMNVIFPLVNFLNKFYRKPLLHNCIGGYLDKRVQEHTNILKHLNKFEVNWVQSLNMKKRLENLGVNNVEYLPNFKRLTTIDKDSIEMNPKSPLKFCTFSRVTKSKGIGLACEAINKINSEYGKIVAVLDVYGAYEEGYQTELEKYIASSNGAISYKGVIEFDKTVEILKEYYMLLFPTTFRGEGFPGTVVDSYYSALPIIATNWNLNEEVITDNRTGLIYDYKKEEKLLELIKFSIANPQKIYEMKLNCLEKSKQYSPETVMDIITDKINLYIK